MGSLHVKSWQFLTQGCGHKWNLFSTTNKAGKMNQFSLNYHELRDEVQ